MRACLDGWIDGAAAMTIRLRIDSLVTCRAWTRHPAPSRSAVDRRARVSERDVAVDHIEAGRRRSTPDPLERQIWPGTTLRVLKNLQHESRSGGNRSAGLRGWTTRSGEGCRRCRSGSCQPVSTTISHAPAHARDRGGQVAACSGTVVPRRVGRRWRSPCGPGANTDADASRPPTTPPGHDRRAGGLCRNAPDAHPGRRENTRFLVSTFRTVSATRSPSSTLANDVSTFRVGRQPELSGQLLKVDGRHERVGGTLRLETGGMAQDIKLFPEGKVFTSQTWWLAASGK